MQSKVVNRNLLARVPSIATSAAHALLLGATLRPEAATSSASYRRSGLLRCVVVQCLQHVLLAVHTMRQQVWS